MSIAPPPHRRSKKSSDAWITPKWIVDGLGPFDLDPCAAEPQPWRTATRMITEKDNGLLDIWKGFVWCNPPYGRELPIWLERMALHNNGIALTFARTETRAFFDNVWPHASALLFLRGRVSFFKPDGSPSPKGHNSGGPSVLIAYGDQAKARLSKQNKWGYFLEIL